jgi:hypothetical protein
MTTAIKLREVGYPVYYYLRTSSVIRLLAARLGSVK